MNGNTSHVYLYIAGTFSKKIKFIIMQQDDVYETQIEYMGFLNYEIGRVSILKKIALAPMRNAFLLLVKLNAFKFAEKLYKTLNTKEAALKSKWEKLGGNFGALKKVILKRIAKRKHSGKSIGQIDSDEQIGVLPLAAAIAAATPIIKILSEFLGKMNTKQAPDADTN